MNQTWTSFLPHFIRSKLEGRYNLQKVAANTGWLFADKIFRMGVGLFVMVWLARYLGPDQFGIYNYSLAFVFLLSPIAALGLDSIVVRNIVRDPQYTHEILGAAFILKLMGGILALLMTFGLISMVRPDDQLIRWMVGIIALGMIFQAFDVIDFWFQSQVCSKFTVYAKGMAFMFASAAKVGFILSGASLITLAWIGLFESVVGVLGLVFVYRKNMNFISEWRGNLGQGKKLLKDSWPLIFSGLAVMIYMRIDQIMLGEMIGDGSVGIYSAAVRLSEAWYFIPMAIVSSVFPSIIDAKKTDEKLYQQRLQKLYYLMTWIAVSIAIPVTLLSESIIRLLYGGRYAGAEMVLVIHIWAGVFVFLGIASSRFLVTENYTRIALYRTLTGAGVNVGLNLYFIPLYGINGAAAATLFSYFVATFFIALNRKTRKQCTMMFKSILILSLLKERSRDQNNSLESH